MSEIIHTAEELILQQDAEIGRLSESVEKAREFVASEITALKESVGSSLTKSISEIFSTTEKTLSEFETAIGAKASESERTLLNTTRTAIAALRKEMESVISQKAEDTARAFDTRIASIVESHENVRRDFERQSGEMVKRALESQPKPNGFLDIFRGNWTKDLPLKRGELFGFRGSTYVALKDVVGLVPTRQLQTGPDPTYQIVAATGAPGPQGQPGTNGSGGSGINWATAPVNASDSGTAGQVAYDGSYFYICSATNTWIRTPMGSW